jgi:hypothetical protein
MKKFLYTYLGNNLMKGVIPGLFFFLLFLQSNGLKAQIYSANFNSNIQSWVNGSSNSWSRVSTGGVSNTGCLTSTIVCEEGQQQGSCINQNYYFIATPAVSLTGGNTYQISIKCSVATASTRKLVLGVNTSQARSGATTLQNFGYVSTGSYNSFTFNYTPTSTGSPYFVLWGEKFTTQSVGLWLDDFAVTLVNSAPTVSLTKPDNNSIYVQGDSPFIFQASASDAENNLSKVEFFSNGTKVGERNSLPLSINYIPTVGGTYSLTAKATDSYGAATTSAARSISFRTLPVIEYVTPDLEFSSYAEGPLNLVVNASDADGTMSSVKFYIDDNLVYTDVASPWTYNWTATPGSHAFKAVATDNHGLESTASLDPAGFDVVANTCSLSAPTSSSTTICEGASLTLTSGYSSLLTGSIQWQRQPTGGSWANISGATSTSYSATLAGNYRGVWTFENGATCMTAVDSLFIDSIKARTVIGIDYSNGVAHAVSQVVSGYGPYSFSWTNVDGSYELANGDSAIIDSIQYYTWVTITDSIGCVANDTAYSPVFGRRLLPLSPADITDPPCTLSGTNLLCNSSFEETNATSDPYHGTGNLPGNMLNWYGSGFQPGAINNQFGYVANVGNPAFLVGTLSLGFDLPDNVFIEEGDPSDFLSVTTPPGGGNAMFFKAMHDFNGIGGNEVGQLLNGPIVKEKKYIIQFKAKYSKRYDFRVAKIFFYLLSSTVGAPPVFVPITVPNALYLNDWKRMHQIFSVPNINAFAYDQIRLGNSGNGSPSNPGNFFYIPPGDPILDPDGLVRWGGTFTYFDMFYLAQLPEVACSQMIKSTSSVTLGLNQNSTWLSDFVSNTGATFAWSPTTGLTNANTASPTANPGITTTYTCKVTIDGVEHIIGTTEVKVIDESDITFSQNICSDYVTIGNTFPSGTTFVWTKPDNSNTTSGSFNIAFPLTSGNALSVVVTGSCAGNSATVATTIPGSGLTQTDPTTLGDNPRACCGTLTKTINQNCTDDVDANSKKDYFHSFTLSKYCGLWPSLYVSSKDCGFPVYTYFEYFDGSGWTPVDFGSSEGNGKTWNLDNEGTQNIGSPLPNPALFRIHLESQSTSPSGNFDLKISSVEATINGATSCESRFVGCCRMAVQPGEPELENFRLKISPNPTTGEFTIRVSTLESETAYLEIVDLLGRPKFQQDIFTQDIRLSSEGMPAGIYLVKCSKGNKTVTNRLFISK